MENKKDKRARLINLWTLIVLVLVLLSVLSKPSLSKIRYENEYNNIEILAHVDSVLRAQAELIKCYSSYYSLKTSYRVVYDNNSIVRTVKRPDDVMAEYNRLMEELSIKINELRY
jgi:hypothetical protein